MELFYSKNIKNGICVLDEEEGRHCLKVLRHIAGDHIQVIDGTGNLYECEILEGKKEVTCRVLTTRERFGAHPYRLVMAVAPTKNIDRYEWFLEKATEVGMDVVVPVIGEHSERKIIKPERLEKILVSAAKQSLKAYVPVLEPQINLNDFIRQAPEGLRLIAYCGEAEKVSLPQALATWRANQPAGGEESSSITLLIGPEGDFSPQEVETALAHGFQPVHLGASRLRTETAAVAAVCGVYFTIG